MTYRALAFGLLFALAAHAKEEVIDDEALKPQMEDLKARFDQVKANTLKVDEFIAYYHQRAQAKAAPKDMAINAYLYGFVLTNVGANKTKEARAEFERAVGLMPGLLAAHLELALIAEKSGDRTQAERLVRQTLGIKPEYVRATVQLGQIAQRAGEYDRAKGIYEKSLEVEPTVQALSALVIVNTVLFRKCFDEREKEKLARQALAAADAVVTIEPDNQALRLAKAEVYLNLGRIREAVEYLENLYAQGTLKPEIQLELLRFLRKIYQAQGNVEGVKATLERMLACETMRPEERARISERLKDLERMGRSAFTKWMVEEAVQALHNEGLSVEMRLGVLRELWGFITSEAIDREELRPLVKLAWDECFRTLVDGTPELLAIQLRALRDTKPSPRLMAVLVHFVHPGGVTPEVREEGIRAVAAVGGIAAIPSIYYSLQDDSGRVVREADSQLSILCERRSPLGGSIEAYTDEQVKEARRAWAKYFHTADGGARLAKGFEELGKSILKVRPDATTRPMIDHAAHVLLDGDVPWPAWAAAYEFLVTYWGKEFRPVDRRGKPVEPFDREPVVKAFLADYRGRSAAEPDDAEPLPAGGAGMAKEK